MTPPRLQQQQARHIQRWMQMQRDHLVASQQQQQMGQPVRLQQLLQLPLLLRVLRRLRHEQQTQKRVSGDSY